MPRVSRLQANLNRHAIADASARLFRERGVNEVSVAQATAAAGLTHGGFYGHFASKDSLAGEACKRAFDASAARWRKRIAQHSGAKSARLAIIDAYLCPQSRNSPGTACATATLVTDTARSAEGAPLRDAFAAGVEELLDLLASLQPGAKSAAARANALTDLSTMVGAMLLARATAGRVMSDEFLYCARDHLAAGARRRVR